MPAGDTRQCRSMNSSFVIRPSILTLTDPTAHGSPGLAGCARRRHCPTVRAGFTAPPPASWPQFAHLYSFVRLCSGLNEIKSSEPYLAYRKRSTMETDYPRPRAGYKIRGRSRVLCPEERGWGWGEAGKAGMPRQSHSGVWAVGAQGRGDSGVGAVGAQRGYSLLS